MPCRPAAAVALAAALVASAAAAPAAEPSLADREAIEATLMRYTRGLDRLDADLYVSAMTPDVLIVVDGQEHRGHDAMRDIIAEEAALRAEDPRTLFHLETNSSIEITAPDRATHHTYWLTMTRTGEGQGSVSVLDMGSSSDELHKIDGEWLIARRDIYLTP